MTIEEQRMEVNTNTVIQIAYKKRHVNIWWSWWILFIA
jgi:hypothetical protein